VGDISMTDAPVVPGIVSTPIVSHLEFKITEKPGENTGKISRAEKKSSNEKVAGAPCDKVVTESQRMMNAIDGSKLLHEELIRREPSLASISSFLNTVCGGTAREKKAEKTEEANIRITENKVTSVTLPIKTRSEMKYMEKQRVSRILVAKTLLEEELAKDEPSLFSIAAFRTAAYGGDGSEGKEPVCDIVETEETLITAKTIPIISQPSATTSSTQLIEAQVTGTGGTCGAEAITVVPEEAEVVLSDDAALSIDGSDDDEKGSDGFTRSESSSSHGESTVNSASRKRRADGSPERELRGTDCNEFSGTVTHSEGGCRIYVPTTTRDKTTETISRTLMSTDVERGSDTVNATGATTVENATDAPETSLETAVVSSAATTEAVPTASTTKSMRAADVIMGGNDVSTMFVVDDADTPKLVSKEKVAISSDVISVMWTCTSTIVVCPTPVIEFLT